MTTTARSAAQATTEAIVAAQATYGQNSYGEDRFSVLAALPINHGDRKGYGVVLAVCGTAPGVEALVGIVLTFDPTPDELWLQNVDLTAVPGDAVGVALDTAGWDIGPNRDGARRVGELVRDKAADLLAAANARRSAADVAEREGRLSDGDALRLAADARDEEARVWAALAVQVEHRGGARA